MTDQTEHLASQSLETVRAAIAGLVPEAMDRAVGSYRDFVTVTVPLDAKEFKDHHTAGRTALVHLESLLRLARWAALPATLGSDAGEAEEGSGEKNDPPGIDTMLLDASRALTALCADAGDLS